MFSRFLGELLAAFLIGLSSMRFLYAKRIQFDVLSVLPLIALAVTLLNFIAFGFSMIGIALLAISFLAFLWNIRYLIRLSNHLFLDHFSTWFVVMGIINTILCLVIAIHTITYRPVSIPLRKDGIYQTRTYYTGSFQEGFTEAAPFQKRTCTLYKYEKYVKPYHDSISEMRAQAKIIEMEENGEEPPMDLVERAFSSRNSQVPYEKLGSVFLLPNKCASVNYYLPFIHELVEKGYTVYSAEFYTDDIQWYGDYRDMQIFRRMFFLMDRLDESKKDELLAKNEYHSKDFISEIQAMISLSGAEEDLYRFVVGDSDSAKAIQMLHSGTLDNMNSCYDLASIEGYKTPGFGQIDQMEPVLAHHLGFSRNPSMDNTKEIVDTLETELVFQAKINELQKIQESSFRQEQESEETVLPEDQLQDEEFEIENQFDMMGLE